MSPIFFLEIYLSFSKIAAPAPVLGQFGSKNKNFRNFCLLAR